MTGKDAGDSKQILTAQSDGGIQIMPIREVVSKN